MTTTPTSAGSSGLVDRAKNILLQPKAEWDRIAAEPATQQDVPWAIYCRCS